MRTTPVKTQEVRVRTARIEDADAIAVLSGQLGYPCSGAGVRRRLRNLLARPDHAIWVAENNGGSVAGWIHVLMHQVLESDPQAEIGGLVIDERFRGQGAGKALIERAERWAKARRLNSVYVRSNIIRKKAHIFYQKRGYNIIKTQHAFRKDL